MLPVPLPDRWGHVSPLRPGRSSEGQRKGRRKGGKEGEKTEKALRKEKTIYRCEGKGEKERARLLWKTAEEETTKGGKGERGRGRQGHLQRLHNHVIKMGRNVAEVVLVGANGANGGGVA